MPIKSSATLPTDAAASDKWKQFWNNLKEKTSKLYELCKPYSVQIGVVVFVLVLVGTAVAFLESGHGHTVNVIESVLFVLLVASVLVGLFLFYKTYNNRKGQVSNLMQRIAQNYRASDQHIKTKKDYQNDGDLVDKEKEDATFMLDAIARTDTAFCDCLLECGELAARIYNSTSMDVPGFESKKIEEGPTKAMVMWKKDNQNVVQDMVIVVRGTDNSEDMVTDASAMPIPLFTTNRIWGDNLKEADEIKHLKMHKGFAQRTYDVCKHLDQIMASLKFDNSTRIVCTGHSLGGAVATLLGMVLCTEHDNLQVQVVTFGAPRIFMWHDQQLDQMQTNDNRVKLCTKIVEEFEKSFNTFVALPHFARLRVIRINSPNDLVPKLPMIKMGHDFAKSSNQVYIQLQRKDEIDQDNLVNKGDQKNTDRLVMCKESSGLPPEKGSVETIIEYVDRVFSANKHKMTSYLDGLQAVRATKTTIQATNVTGMNRVFTSDALKWNVRPAQRDASSAGSLSRFYKRN